MSTARKCKTKYFVKSAFIYSAVVAGLIFGAKMIFAQNEIRTITIVPPSNDFTADPGERREGNLKVVNSGTTPLTFKVQVKDFVVDDTVGTPHILPDNTLSQKYSASSWIAVIPDTFTVPAGKTQKLNYYLQIPSTARPGGHYAAIVYEPQEVLGVQGTGTGVETHVGTLFYVRVTGNIIENATVKKFTPQNTLNEYGPITINTQIINYSDTHIKPIGTVSIKNLFGQVVYSQSLEAHNIFPEATRDFTNSIGRKLMFGPYTAELKATYGTANNLTLFASAGFFVLPWKIVAVVVLAIVVAILLFIYFRKKKKQKESNPIPTQTPQMPPAPLV